jgi:predicted DNA-binding protein (MmcQ/YjbR family)
MPSKTPFDAVIKKLRAHALAYPETREDFPWGERAWKVKGKVFVFAYADAKVFGISAKLPVTFTDMLKLPFAEPTGYGLGKAGWVSCRFAPKDKKKIPVDLLLAWIDESYRAVAPKSLVKKLAGG